MKIKERNLVLQFVHVFNLLVIFYIWKYKSLLTLKIKKKFPIYKMIMNNLFFNVIQFQGITKKLQSNFYKNIFLLYTIKKKIKPIYLSYINLF